MDTRKMRKVKWFWLWQDAKQEDWLRRMSLDGWHLVSPGRLVFTFQQGPPQEFTYRLDFFNKSEMSFLGDPADRRSEYLGIFEDSGWEHLGQVGGWQYFRTPGSLDGSHVVSTEVESKIEYYRRLLRNLLLTSPVLLVVFLPRLEIYPIWFAVLLLTVFVVGLLFAGLNGVMISLRIRQLKNE
ncbi:MAG: DUF2812 domain-containing protein [Anaerolineales bacterium]|nr:DUF2812 domain-containing protein [Anaerolineales bacterium]